MVVWRCAHERRLCHGFKMNFGLRLFQAVLLLPILYRLQASRHGLSRTLYVQPWTSGNELLEAPLLGQDRTCDFDHPCASLRDALDAARTYQASSRVLHSDELPAQVTIRLLTNTSSECRVLLFRPDTIACSSSVNRTTNHSAANETKSGKLVSVPILNWRMAHIIVDGNNENFSCQRTRLVPPPLPACCLAANRDQRYRLWFLLNITNSSMLTFKNVELDREHVMNVSRVSYYTGLLNVEASSLVKFVDCLFCSQFSFGPNSHQHVRVVNSKYVIFDRCHFIDRQATGIDDLSVVKLVAQKSSRAKKHRVSAALLVAYWPSGILPNMTPKEDSFVRPFFADTPYEGEAQNTGFSEWDRKCRHTDITRCFPDVLLLNSVISGTGFQPSAQSHAENIELGDVKYARASGIYCLLKRVESYNIVLRGCTVTDNSAPLGTPVLFDIVQNYNSRHNTSDVENSLVHISNCTFTNNSGLFGGAVGVSISTESWRSRSRNRTSLLLMENCTFGNNLAYREGGAVFIKQFSRITTTNCIHMDSLVFNNNAARFGRERQHGGAISISAMTDVNTLTKKRQFVDNLHTCEADSQLSVVFHSLALSGNTGVGGVWIKNIYAGFSGNR